MNNVLSETLFEALDNCLLRGGRSLVLCSVPRVGPSYRRMRRRFVSHPARMLHPGPNLNGPRACSLVARGFHLLVVVLDFLLSLQVQI